MGKHYSGSTSPSDMKHNSGPKGAGELTFGTAPGKAAMKTKPHMSGTGFEGGKNSYSPKGMKTYNQE